MNLSAFNIYTPRHKMYWLLFAFAFFATGSMAQKNKADSISALLATEKTDSNRVRLLWKLGSAISIYNADSALLLSQQALFLAKKIKDIEGQSRSLGVMANTFTKMGNYPRALQANIEKLQLEEKRNMPRNMGSVLMNIGTVYYFQEEYRKALEYYLQSDAVIKKNNVKDLQYYILLNVGDTYNRLGNTDSAFIYFNKSLAEARQLNDGDLIGTSMTGLGHIYLKQQQYPLSLNNYKEGINYLKAANDDDILCEATLGLAKLFIELKDNDSAVYYASQSESIAKRAGFISRQLDAVTFLTDHYKETKNADSAFAYMTYVKELNDSVNSKTRIRESQLLSSNEHLRQQEIEQQKEIAKKMRDQQLQMLFIGIFIPGLFLLTFLLSRKKIHIRLIKILGILSLLMLFEYLTLFLHPYVLELTHHKPVFEMLIFVSIAAILIPAHHRIEAWVIKMLTRHHNTQPGKSPVFKTVRMKIKNPSG